MGTRADFYIGRGLNAEWIGSIGWDGYPDGIDNAILSTTSEQDFREAVFSHMGKRDDWTNPDQGWPWPWATSHTTDYAYTFDGDCVWVSSFGAPWFVATEEDPESESDDSDVEFPDMTDRQNVTFGQRSGVMIVGV